MSVSTLLPPVPEHLAPTDSSPIVARAADRTQSVFWLYAAPIAAGFVIRMIVALVWLGQTVPHNDAADYFSEASKLYEGTRGAVPFYWPPGTTYYLWGWFAAFGTSFTVARLSMVVLSTAQIAITGFLVRQSGQSRSAASIGCWLWAIYPPSVFLVFQPYSQHLAAFSLAAITLCGIKWLTSRSNIWIVLLGLSLGVGCLTRPSMMSVTGTAGLFVFVATLFQSGCWMKRLLDAAARCQLLIVPFAIVVTPTIAFNANAGGGVTLSTNNERNFFLGNNPYTPWYKTSHFAQRSLDELPLEVQTYLKSLYSASDRRAAMTSAAMTHIRENPGLTALRTVNRARAFWGFDYLASRVVEATTGSKLASRAVLLAEAAGYCAMVMLAIVAVIHWKGFVARQSLIWYLAVIVAYWFPYCLAFSGGTYHFPVMGVVVPLSAIGLHILFANGWRKNLSSWSLWSCLALFVAMQCEYAYFTLAAGQSGYSEVHSQSSNES